MKNFNEFDWVDFYREFAERLLDFKDDRKKLIEIIKSVYKEIGITLPKLDTDHKMTDIDPFTVFGLFNKGITKQNRLKIITEFAKQLDLKTDIPKSFNSVPVLNNLNATFYYFEGDTKAEDIENLWSLFEVALEYSSSPNEKNKERLGKYFDLAINQKGIGNSKLTMGLYWIAPKTFLNLDSRNEWYIYESGKLPNSMVSSLPAMEAKIPASKYFVISEKVGEYLGNEASKSNSFQELSSNAWKHSTEVNESRKKTARDEKGAGLADTDVDVVHYWLYSPGTGSYKWEDFYEKGIMAIGWSGIGDLNNYSNKDEMVHKFQEINNTSSSYKNRVLATWEFANEMKVGDIVFVKEGVDKIIGRGIVESDYMYDLSVEDDFKNTRQVNWTHKGEWDHPGKAAVKTLTDITAYTEYVESLKGLFEIEGEDEVEEMAYPVYDKEDFLEEVFIDADAYRTLRGLLDNKKNLILQGAPGVGKTFIAKRLAYSILGEKDQDKVMMVQFHQSYSYEDFIEGFRPSKDGQGFEIKKGAFYSFCKKAADDIDNDYFFIIDEINRGNLSKIFGELFMLIENDKRGNTLQLLYSDEKFSVPANVYIIGMMNTADRSLAMLDYALRRRFAFYNLSPAFKSKGFLNYQRNLNDDKFDRLINCAQSLNRDIESDESLGKGFCIGHSYFCNLTSTEGDRLERIVEYEIIPLINEYWFDEPSKVEDWERKLRGSIK